MREEAIKAVVAATKKLSKALAEEVVENRMASSDDSQAGFGYYQEIGQAEEELYNALNTFFEEKTNA